jgi:NadR type nicotinamide-nucleotide adenylyltransferase
MAALTRICLIGAESTGKSQLAAELAATLKTVWVPEFAREYALKVQRQLDYFDVFPIARGQIQNEDRVLANARGIVILDTDLLSTVAYSRYYFGVCPDWIEQTARERLADLYLFMNIDVPWIGDPARDPKAKREEVHAEFGKALAEFGANCVLISGGWETRRETAIKQVRALESR